MLSLVSDEINDSVVHAATRNKEIKDQNAEGGQEDQQEKRVRFSNVPATRAVPLFVVQGAGPLVDVGRDELDLGVHVPVVELRAAGEAVLLGHGLVAVHVVHHVEVAHLVVAGWAGTGKLGL